jgi:DNA-binding Xre family transcriptional regulator
VSNLEAETSAPKLETVRRLATALRCSVSDLIGYADE